MLVDSHRSKCVDKRHVWKCIGGGSAGAPLRAIKQAELLHPGAAAGLTSINNTINSITTRRVTTRRGSSQSNQKQNAVFKPHARIWTKSKRLRSRDIFISLVNLCSRSGNILPPPRKLRLQPTCENTSIPQHSSVPPCFVFFSPLRSFGPGVHKSPQSALRLSCLRLRRAVAAARNPRAFCQIAFVVAKSIMQP